MPREQGRWVGKGLFEFRAHTHIPQEYDMGVSDTHEVASCSMPAFGSFSSDRLKETRVGPNFLFSSYCLKVELRPEKCRSIGRVFARVLGAIRLPVISTGDRQYRRQRMAKPRLERFSGVGTGLERVVTFPPPAGMPLPGESRTAPRSEEHQGAVG
jgi:hypothetical protein